MITSFDNYFLVIFQFFFFFSVFYFSLSLSLSLSLGLGLSFSTSCSYFHSLFFSSVLFCEVGADGWKRAAVAFVATNNNFWFSISGYSVTAGLSTPTNIFGLLYSQETDLLFSIK